MFKRDEYVARLDVQVDELLAVDVLKAFGHVDEEALELRLRQLAARLTKLLDLPLEAASLAVLVLNVNLSRKIST